MDCELFTTEHKKLTQVVRLWLTLALLILLTSANAQGYNASRIFAHNDYARALPFYTAYELQVGYIEADVFLMDGEILVAHHKQEIESGKTLETLYLKPLLKQINKNKGSVYQDPSRTLTLMVDLKTEGDVTLRAVVDQIEKYPDLLSCSTLHFLISGSVPDPVKWNDYPPFIYFDGRPGISYTPEQLKKISMISTSFGAHINWNGSGKIPEKAQNKIRVLVDEAHSKGKKFRFWATPDFQNAWQELMDLQMDVIVTDDVTALAAYLNNQK